jgi:DNA-binding transcriptional MerR regulator
MAELKNTYTSREVAGITGLTARQLQWWDDKRLFASHIAPKKTARGGYTERRYTPLDLLELLVLAELQRQGLSAAQLRRLLDTLRDRFGLRLFETVGGGGSLTLLTDGHDVFGRTADGELFNLLRDPLQPLLMVQEVDGLRELSARTSKSRKRKRSRSRSPATE